MWNGIKPTRLWYLTGMKHFRNMICARMNASCHRVYEQRKREHLILMYGVAVANALLFAYLFGFFSGPKPCVFPEDAEVHPPCPSDPCPPLKPYPRPKPCPPRF